MKLSLSILLLVLAVSNALVDAETAPDTEENSASLRGGAARKLPHIVTFDGLKPQTKDSTQIETQYKKENGDAKVVPQTKDSIQYEALEDDDVDSIKIEALEDKGDNAYLGDLKYNVIDGDYNDLVVRNGDAEVVPQAMDFGDTMKIEALEDDDE